MGGGGVLNKDIIDEWNIRFNESLDYKEDHLFMAQYICHINTIGMIRSESYHYRMTPNSLVQGDSLRNCNRDIVAFHAAVCELEKQRDINGTTIFSRVCRLFMNAVVGDWASTGFSAEIDMPDFYEASKKFRYAYIIRSNLCLREKAKELVLHMPLFWTRSALRVGYRIRGMLKGKERS